MLSYASYLMLVLYKRMIVADTYNGNLAAELILDVSLLDSIGTMLVDDRE